MVCAGIVGENGRDGRNMACRQADRGPQDWGPDWGGFHTLGQWLCVPTRRAILFSCPRSVLCWSAALSALTAPGRTTMMPELLEGFPQHVL